MPNGNGNNPWYKRSGFGQIVLYVVSVGAWYFFDEKPIGSEEVIQLVTMGLLLFGYQVKRPSQPA